MKRVFVVLLVLISCFNVIAQNNLTKENCQAVFKEGNVLKYKDTNYSRTVIKIKNGFHIEHMKDSKVKLKSSITWLSNCRVKLQVVDVKGAGKNKFRVGQTLTIDIYNVIDNSYFYKAKLGSGDFGMVGVLIVQN